MGFVADGSRGRVVGEYRGKKDQVSSWGHDCQRICCFSKTFRIATFACVKGKAREMFWKIFGEPSMSSWSISSPSTLKKLHSISATAPCLSNSLASTSVMKQPTKVGASRSIPAMETNAASDPPGAGWTKIQFEEGHQPFSPLNVRPVPEARWLFQS